MQIFTHSQVSLSCDGCRKAFAVPMPIGIKIREMGRRLRDFHREQSPRCPRDQAALSDQKSYVDGCDQKKHTPHFIMIWRDADELELTKEERRSPMIVIG